MAHLCAGEDLVQPKPAVGAQGTLPRAPKPRYLPRPLVDARALVFHPHAVMDLDLPARRVLYGLLAFYDLKDPNAPIFAYRGTLLAEALIGSLATLYRGLKTLESKGYIERQQGRVRQGPEFGQYERSRVWLTAKARQLLGLRPADLARGELPNVRARARTPCATGSFQDIYPQAPSITVRGGKQKKQPAPEVDSPQPLTEEQPAKTPCTGPAAGRAGMRKKSERKKPTVPGVPEALAFLVTRHQLAASGVFKLMALAKAHGKAGQLEVVAEAAGSTFGQLRGRDAFAYLAKLVRQDKDFARVAALKRDDALNLRTAEAVRALEACIPAFGERYAGYEVLREDGSILGIVTTTGDTHWVRGSGGWLPLNARTMRRFEQGELRVGRRKAAPSAW